MNHDKIFRKKQKVKYIAMIVFYALIYLIVQIGKGCKLFVKNKRKIMAITVCSTMILTMLPAMPLTVHAEAISVAYVEGDGTSAGIKNCTEVEDITTTLDGSVTDGWYVVNSVVTVATLITVTGNVNLILADGCKLTANKGINVADGNSLTIYSQSGRTGELKATTGSMNQAGIGGGSGQKGGNITINGGVVTAIGEYNNSGSGAGIGGGLNGDCGTVTINGGTVTANGGNGFGAGIGGGYGGNGGTITINGGTVTANNKKCAAGIGGGRGGDGGEITINDGTVTATGGIGGGDDGTGGIIIIKGGTVTAIDSGRRAAIGGSDNYDGGNITISGGTVTASTRSGTGKGTIGSRNTNSGTFTTNNGFPLINAGVISDQTNQAKWTGIIYYDNNTAGYGGGSENDYGQVFGSRTIENVTLPAKKLYVPKGTTLTIGEGVTVQGDGAIRNNGTILLQDNETLNGKIEYLLTVNTSDDDATKYAFSFPKFYTSIDNNDYKALDSFPAAYGTYKTPLYVKANLYSQDYTLKKWDDGSVDGSTNNPYAIPATNINPVTLTATAMKNKTSVTVPTISEKTYNGSKQIATVYATSYYDVTTNAGGTDAGNYDVVLTLKNKESYKWDSKDDDEDGVITLPFTINPLSISDFTVGTFGALTYTGSAQTPTATVTKNGMTATGSWSDVTNVADKTTFTASGNFTGTIVNKNPGMVTKTVENDVLALGAIITAPMKNGTPQTEITGQSQYTGTVAWNPTPGEKFLGETEYTATVTLNTTGNYNFDGITAEEFTCAGANITNVKITDNVATVTITFPKTEAYEVTAATVDSSTTQLKKTYTYGETFDPTGLVLNLNYDNGTTGQVICSQDNKTAFTITPATLTMGVTSVNVTYGGQTVTISGITVDKAKVTIPTIDAKTYNGTQQIADVPASDKYTVTENSGGINASRYTVKLTLNDSANYQWEKNDSDGDGVISLTFKIEKKYVEILFTGTTTKVYDGTDTCDGNGLSVGMFDTIYPNNQLTVEGVTPNIGKYIYEDGGTNVGDRKYIQASEFTLTGSDQNNYAINNRNYSKAIGTITPATLTEVSVTQNGALTYSGMAQTAAVTPVATAVNSQTVSFTYCTTESGSYTTTVPAFTAAGSHTVYYKATADNHDPVTGNFTVTIGSKALTDSMVAAAGQTYDGSVKTPVVVMDGSTTLTEGTDYTVNYTDNTNSGTASYTVTGKGNYSGTVSGKTFAIGNATPVVTLTDKTATYTGKAIAANTATVTLVNSETFSGTITYKYYSDKACTTAESETAPIKVGTYYVKALVAAAGNYSAATSDAAKLTITEATPIVTLLDKTAVYTGKVISGNTATITLVNGESYGGTVTYKYYTNAACTMGETETAPTNVGIYYVKASVAAEGNYEAATSSAAKLTITAATPTVTMTDKTSIYTGSAIAANTATVTLVNGESFGGTVTYKYYTNAECTTGETKTAPANAGIYYVKATVTAAGNYSAATSNAAKLTITAAIPTVTLTDKTAVYTGKAISGNSPTVTLLSGETFSGTVTYKYYTNAACTMGETETAPTNAGIYYVKASIAAAGNYKIATSDAAKLTITEAAPVVTLTDKTATYTGKAIAANTATVTLVNSETFSGTITYKYYSDKACTTAESETAPINVGTYYVKASVAAAGNYSAATKVAKLTITAAAPTVTLADKVATYTGSATKSNTATITLVNGESYGGTVTYKYYTNSDCTTGETETAPTNVGIYYVKASIAAAGNYSAATKVAKLTITAAVPTVTLTDKVATYTGSATKSNTATVTLVNGESFNGTVTYKYYTNVECTTGETETAPANAGIYYVKATVTAAGNYSTATSDAAKLTITAVVPTVSLTDKTAIYTGRAIASNTAKVTLVNGESFGGTVTYKYYSNAACTMGETETAPTNVGIYYIKASVAAAGNYKAAISAAVMLTITEAAPVVMLTDKTATYTGKAIAANTATVTLVNSETFSGTITYKYYSDKACTTAESETAPTNVGTYYVKASVAAAGNYSAATKVAKLTITAAAPTVTLTDKVVTYTGSATTSNTATVTLVNGESFGGTVTYKYYTNAACTMGETETAPINAGI